MRKRSGKDKQVQKDPDVGFYHRFDEFTQEERRRAKFCFSDRLHWFCPVEEPQLLLRDAPPPLRAKSCRVASSAVSTVSTAKKQPPSSPNGLFKESHGSPASLRVSQPLTETIVPDRTKYPRQASGIFTKSTDEVESREVEPLQDVRIDHKSFADVVRKTRNRYI